METTDNSRELLDNVTMPEGVPFMIQRVESQLLASELLPTHGGLVVDMSNTEYLQNVTYTTEDLLGHDLTEEDRNLAAALVAVQLGQQQKHQQLTQDSNVIMSANAVTSAALGLDATKDVVSDQHQFLISTVDKPVLTSIDAAYMQAVDNRHLHHTTLPPLKKYTHININPHEQYVTGVKSEFVSIKNEMEHLTEDTTQQRDSDGDTKIDARTSKKSLPHKKRISRKLKKNMNVSKKGHRCNLCNNVFSTIDELSSHDNCQNMNLTPLIVFTCQICNELCKDQLSFFEHLKGHYEPTNQDTTKETSPNKNVEPKDSLLSSLLPPLSCMHCNKNFRRQKAFEAHVREVHSNKIEDEFSEPEDLMEGIRSVVEANDKDTDEETSDTKGWYETDPLRSEETLNGINFQEQVCHLCGQIFNTNEEVMQHLQDCKGTMSEGNDDSESTNKLQAKVKKKKRKSGELYCMNCDRVFSHRNSLMYHMQSHTGERPHQCDVCGKSFFASSALKVHMRLHSGAKPYKCEYCGRHFRQWGDLKYHCISIHSDEKQYQCEYCGKDFARKYSLIVHRRIHTGEKNYRCEFCGKTFRASSYLQNHRRIHTGEKPHPCEVCGKPFRVRSDMKRHLNTHSRRRTSRPASSIENVTSTVGDHPVIEVEVAESIVPDPIEIERTEQKTETENVEQITETAVQFTRDPLEPVPNGTNALFTNGHQVFLLYQSDIRDLPVKAATEGQWIQADD